MQYLSDEWLAAANEALAKAPAPTADSDLSEPAVRIGYTVIGGPGGGRSYVVTVGRSPRFEVGDHNAQVTLTLGYDDAVAIAQGTASAQRAFLDGAIRMGGDVTALLGSAGSLASIDDCLARLRAVTVY